MKRLAATISLTLAVLFGSAYRAAPSPYHSLLSNVSLTGGVPRFIVSSILSSLDLRVRGISSLFEIFQFRDAMYASFN